MTADATPGRPAPESSGGQGPGAPAPGPASPDAGPSGEPAAPDAVVDSRVTHVTAGPGGVMTDEVGVITGDLTLRTELTAAGRVTLRVQYREAAEWYVVTGGRTSLHDPADLVAVHDLAVGLLDRPRG